MPKPLVSIVMITYGHELFIKRAIENVLEQETKFQIELIVANDCSPDNTDQIVKEIISDHPKASLIKYFKREKNLGIMPNFYDALWKSTGKYIAICEGDDYWTDPNKLQTQVDFLENHTDYTICFHSAKVIEQKSGKLLYNLRPHLGNRTFSTSAVIEGGGSFMPTASMVFRCDIIKDLPGWFQTAPVGDIFLSIYSAIKGKVYYIDKLMAVYQVNNSNWSSEMLAKDGFRKRYNLHTTMISLLEKIRDSKDKIHTKSLDRLISKSIKSLLIDNYDKEFEINDRKRLINKLSFVQRLDLTFNIKAPKIYYIYNKCKNLFKFVF